MAFLGKADLVEGDEFPLDELDAAGVLERAQVVLLSRRAAEVEDLRLVAHWALLHGGDPKDDPAASGWDRLDRHRWGGHPEGAGPVPGRARGGTPGPRPLPRSAMADVLDLIHRLPRTWAVRDQAGV